MKRIIIVDDDPAILDAFSMIFDPKQYEVVAYANGQMIIKN